MTGDRVAPQPPLEADGEPRWGGQQRITYLARADSLTRASVAGFNVQIECERCASSRVVAIDPLIDLAIGQQWPGDFMQLGDRLRCRACRGPARLRATDLPPDSPPIGPSSIDDYRVIVRRLARLISRLKRR